MRLGWLRGGGIVVGASAAVLGGLLLMAACAPLIAPYDYREQNRQFPNCPPSPEAKCWVSSTPLAQRSAV